MPVCIYINKMSISSQIHFASEGNFKLAQKIVTALSEKYSFDFAKVGKYFQTAM